MPDVTEDVLDLWQHSAGHTYTCHEQPGPFGPPVTIATPPSSAIVPVHMVGITSGAARSRIRPKELVRPLEAILDDFSNRELAIRLTSIARSASLALLTNSLACLICASGELLFEARLISFALGAMYLEPDIRSEELLTNRASSERDLASTGLTQPRKTQVSEWP